jgi:hypothetical protein
VIIVGLAWGLSLVACDRPPEERPPRPVPEPPALTFTELAATHGFVVQQGALGPMDTEDCCLPNVNCLMGNPSTPYLVTSLPPAPGQAPEPLADESGLARTWHQRADEAVVLLGTTPPEAKYFSWRSYLMFRYEPDGTTLEVMGALGPSLNHQVVAAEHGDHPLFDAPFALVSTMDAAVEQQVVDWLVQAGWDPGHVHRDRIPPELVRPGLDPSDDTFMLLGRAAVFTDPVVGDAWNQEPGFTVLRVTPDGPESAPVAPHPLQPLPPRGSGTDEEGLRAALDLLGGSIAFRYRGRPVVAGTSQPFVYETYTCIEQGYCAFDMQDRYYAKLLPVHLPADGTFLVAYGVNHERSGKASYANLAVNDQFNKMGLEAIESDVLPGSARPFLPNHPDGDDLYAVVVTRDCAGFDGMVCVEVPEGCPGVELDHKVSVDFRAYLDPVSGAGPLVTEILPDRGLLFGPLPPDPGTTTGTTGTGTGTSTTTN